jgi:alkaline phosphatase D
MVQHGYGVLEATASEMRFDYRQVDKLDPHAGVRTSYSFHVESGQPAVEA